MAVSDTGTDDTLYGGKGNDVLTGSAGNDFIDGKEGSDTAVFSGNRADYAVSYDGPMGQYVLSGPDGTDRMMNMEYVQFEDTTVSIANLYTGSGGGTPEDDHLNGSEGEDLIEGLGGFDYIHAFGGNDTIEGGDGWNSMYGDEGDDLIIGGPYHDHFWGGAGNDTFVGGGGTWPSGFNFNSAHYDDATAPIFGSLATNIVTGASVGTDSLVGIDEISGSPFDDTLEGGTDGDSFWGGAGNDTITGGGGDDVIWGDGGDDVLDGGEGTDYVVFNWRESSMVVDLVAGFAQGLAVGTDQISNFENVSTWLYDDSVKGSSADNYIATIDGNDTVDGGGGNDTISTVDGDDTLIYSGASTDYTVTLNTGSTVITSGGSQPVYTVHDNVEGRDGDDSIVGAEYLQFSDGRFHYTTLLAEDTTPGGSDGDSLHGGKGADTLEGGEGNDTLDGAESEDTAVFSGPLDDYTITWDATLGALIVQDGEDGRDGTDTLFNMELLQFSDALMAVSDYIPVVDDPNDSLYGGKGSDTLEGGEGNDTLSGGDNGDTAVYSGPLEDYTITWDESLGAFIVEDGEDGRDGTDTLYQMEYAQFSDGTVSLGDYLPPDIVGTDEAEELEGTSGQDDMFGLGGNDTLRGLQAGDLMSGDGGDDLLEGGEGNDQLDGGEGNDTAVFSGDFDEYEVSANEDGSFTIHDTVEGRDGTDQVYATESFQFADGTLTGDEIYDGVWPGVIRHGSDLADSLTGTPGDDSLYGGKGNDTVTGGRGNDRISGDNDIDYAVFSGDFDDYEIVYEPITGYYTFTDTVEGRDGTDTVTSVEYFQFTDGVKSLLEVTPGQYYAGAGGDDYLAGGYGDDTLEGFAGNDTFVGNAGDDLMIGGEGRDFASFVGTVSVNLAAGTASGGASDGNDSLTGIENVLTGGGADTITGDGLANYISAGDGGDWISGGAGNDTLYAGKGNDTMLGGAGTDQFMGDQGDDTVVLQGNFADYVFTLLDPQAGFLSITDKVANRDGVDVAYLVEYFQFADGTRTFAQLGATGATSGNDTVTGTPGDDIIGGLAGNDRLIGNAGNDLIRGGDGNDTLLGGDGGDHLVGGAGNDLLDGGAGMDIANYDGATSNLKINLDASTITAGSLGKDTIVSIEGIIGGTGNDRFTGNKEANYLFGNAGDDTLDGGAGADSLFGFTGNDTYTTDGNDYIEEVGSEDGGIDTVFSSGSIQLPLYLEDVTLTGNAASAWGNASHNAMTGNTRDNWLEGGEGNDTLNGGRGADTLYGGKGDDTYFVDAVGDVVAEDDGYDTLYSTVDVTNALGIEVIVLQGRAALANGGTEDNTITGNAAANGIDGGYGNDSLRGEGGSDSLYGRDGDDWLDGGAGSDSLTGGKGADTFHFGAAFARGAFDRITDMEEADTIALDNAVFKALAEGALPEAAFQAAATNSAATAAVRIVFNTSTGALFYDADGSGRGAAQQFAVVTLTGGSLSADDFSVV